MDENRKTVERRRAAARGWVSRSVKALKELLADDDVGRVALEDAIDDLDRRLASLDDAQSSVELLISDPKKLEEDIDEADQFRRQVRVPRLQAAQMLLEMAKEKQKGETASSIKSSGADSVINTVKLPTIQLPKFSGDVLEWQSFWDQFMELVDESNLPDVGKFGYLHVSLEGEARRVIQGLSLTAANYPTACSLLKERFGRSERIIFAHIQELLDITAPPKTSGPQYITSLWKMQDQLVSHARSLEVLNVKEDQYGVILTPVILSRLPHDLRIEWAREGSGHENDLSWLMKFLQQELEHRERSESFRGERNK